MDRFKQNRDEMDVVLSTEQFQEISECLSRLAEKLRVIAIFLINNSGGLVAQKVSDRWKGDSTLLSTLTAGSYSASREMARLLGEEANFKMVLHEGKQQNVIVSSIDKDFFLIVVFETGVAIGMVRLFTKKTIEHLHPILSRRGMGQVRMEQVIDQRFQALLGEELDRSLKEI